MKREPQIVYQIEHTSLYKETYNKSQRQPFNNHEKSNLEREILIYGVPGKEKGIAFKYDVIRASIHCQKDKS